MPLIDTTSFGVDAPSTAVGTSGDPESEDAAFSGLLWPLVESVKLATIDRRTLGYALDFKSQEWKRQLEHQAA